MGDTINWGTLTTYNLANLNKEISTYFDQATRDNRQLFADFVAIWTGVKAGIFEHVLNHKEGGDQKAKAVTDEFQKLVDEIILELNKQ